MEISTVNTIDLNNDVLYENEHQEDVKVFNNIDDSFGASYDDLGYLDIDDIVKRSVFNKRKVIKQLLKDNIIVRDPSDWNETKYLLVKEYLDGPNIFDKLDRAKLAEAMCPGEFTNNIKLIKSVIPNAYLYGDDVYLTFSNFAVKEHLDEIIVSILGYPSLNYGKLKDAISTKFNNDGSVTIPYKNRYPRSHTKCYVTYGTIDFCALHIIERLANNKPVVPENCKWDKKKVAFIRTAAEKLEKEELQSVIRNDKELFSSILKKLERTIYHVSYKQDYSRFITFDGLSPDVSFRDSQKSLIYEMCYERSGNILLCPKPGFGKTCTSIGFCEKERQLGRAKRIMIIANFENIPEWKNTYKQFFPNAKVLVLPPGEFRPAKLQATLKRIKEEEYNAVIIAKSTLVHLLDVSPEFYLNEMYEEQAQLREAYENHKTSSLNKKLIALSSKILSQQNLCEATKDDLFFDRLGLDRIIVDEAHDLKNVPFKTSWHIKGINPTGSKSMQRVFNMLNCVEKQGARIVFVSATPMPNSIADCFTIQRYLQGDTLKRLGIDNFDQWSGMFSEVGLSEEIDIDPNSFVRTYRLKSYHNVRQLANILSQIMCYRGDEEDPDVPQFKGFEVVLSKPDSFQKKYFEEITERTENVRKGNVDAKEDNPLKITADGQIVSLDSRFRYPNASLYIGGKLNKCAQNVSQIYHDTAEEKLTQIVFCDVRKSSQSSFDSYKELKRLFVNNGINPDEIVFAQEYKTVSSREKLYKKINEGEIRVVISSTDSIGRGTNVQTRLCALHFLTPPWRPDKLTQALGRMYRKGNKASFHKCFIYCTENTTDLFKWQTLERKERDNNAIMKNEDVVNDIQHVDYMATSCAEVKAAITGNPAWKKKFSLENEINRLKLLRQKSNEDIVRLENDLKELKIRRSQQITNITRLHVDMAVANKNAKYDDKEMRAQVIETLANAIQASRQANYTERVALFYRGFRIVVPKQNDADSLTIFVQNDDGFRYPIEVTSQKGTLVKIDNLLDGFENEAEKAKENVRMLTKNIKTSTEEYEKKSSKEMELYNMQIELLQLQLDQINSLLDIKEI